MLTLALGCAADAVRLSSGLATVTPGLAGDGLGVGSFRC